jgi:hypothetical protein
MSTLCRSVIRAQEVKAARNNHSDYSRVTATARGTEAARSNTSLRAKKHRVSP